MPDRRKRQERQATKKSTRYTHPEKAILFCVVLAQGVAIPDSTERIDWNSIRSRISEEDAVDERTERQRVRLCCVSQREDRLLLMNATDRLLLLLSPPQEVGCGKTDGMLLSLSLTSHIFSSLMSTVPLPPPPFQNGTRGERWPFLKDTSCSHFAPFLFSSLKMCEKANICVQSPVTVQHAHTQRKESALHQTCGCAHHFCLIGFSRSRLSHSFCQSAVHEKFRRKNFF